MIWLRCLSLLSLVAGLAAQDLPPIPQDLTAALAALPVQAKVEGGTPLVVKRDGVPVAGADVFVIDGTKLRAGAAALRRLGEPGDVSMVRRAAVSAYWWGTRYQTDADGIALVALAASDRVHARTPDAVGELPRGALQVGERTIELEALHEVRVQVVDTRGRPAAFVPVRIAWCAPTSRRAGERMATDAKGQVTLHASGAPQGDELAVAVDCIGAPLEFLPVGAAKQLTLTAPPTGMLRVIAYDERERPRAGVREVRLEVAADSGLGAAGMYQSPPQPSKLEPEGATFHGVALGQRFTAHVRFDGVAGEQSVTGDGPKLPNELVVLTLRSKLGDPALPLRVLDLAGEPYAGRELAMVRASESGYELLRVTPDAQGHVDVLLPADWRAAEGRRLLLVARGKTGATTYLGAVDLTGLAQQRLDGARREVQLREEPPLLAGRVVDTEGKPVAGVKLQVDCSWTQQSGVRSFRGSSEVDLTHEVMTDTDGRFVCRELAPKTAKLPLRAIATAWVIASEPHAMAGDQDVKVVLARPGSVVLQLPGVPEGASLVASLERHGQRRTAYKVGAEGRISFETVAPGLWDLQLHVGLADLKISGIEVLAGAVCADPRLVFADWRDKLLLIDTKVQSPQGQPLDVRVDVLIEKPRSSSSMGTSASGGRVLMLTTREATSITLTHADFANVELDPKAIPAEVTMPPRARVVVKLPDGVKLPTGLPMMFFQDGRGRRGEGLVWPEGGKLEVALGSLRDVKVVIQEPREERPGERLNHLLWQGKLELRADAAKQEVTLDLTKEDAERIAQAWAAAKAAEKADQGKR